MNNPNNILITGATGFIGGFIVDKALSLGMNVWVAVRPSSSKKYLTDERINFIHLDFDSKEQMVKAMNSLRFDYVVHAAGVTKCINPQDFYRVNTLGTKNLVEALLELSMPLKRFVYVLDVVQAIFLALENGKIGGKYFLSDGRNYSSRDFSDLICRELGHPWVLRLKAPIWLLRLITFCGEHIGRMTGKVTALNNDKYHIMKQRNWRCDITPSEDELGFHPEYDLDHGVRLTIKWYKDNGWL